MNKSKQIWLLEVEEVERMKARVLKYINLDHTPKSKQKSSHSPSTPHSSLRAGNITPTRRSNQRKGSTSRQATSPFRLQKRSTDGFGPMPKGYALGENGKILKADSPLLKEQGNKQLKQKMTLKSINRQMNKNSDSLSQGVSNLQITVSIPTEQKAKEETGKEKIVEQASVKAVAPEPQAKKFQQIQVNFVSSVFELARRFGGGTFVKKNNPEPPPLINLGSISNIKQNVKQPQEKETPNKNKQDDAKSLASFGRSQTSLNPRKISQFLIMRASQAKQNEKQRKRSYTFQQNMITHEVEQVKNTRQKTDRESYGSSETFNIKINQLKDSNYTERQKKDQTKPQFKSISFSEQEQEQLKLKYSMLSKRLDQLKNKVIQQSHHAESTAVDPDDPVQIRRESIRLYNKYSPLKNLQRICQERIRQQMRQQMRNRTKKVQLKDILRTSG